MPRAGVDWDNQEGGTGRREQGFCPQEALLGCVVVEGGASPRGPSLPLTPAPG